MMDVEKRPFFLKEKLVRERTMIFRCWKAKLKMKNGRFGVEKKDFEVLIKKFQQIDYSGAI